MGKLLSIEPDVLRGEWHRRFFDSLEAELVWDELGQQVQGVATLPPS